MLVKLAAIFFSMILVNNYVPQMLLIMLSEKDRF